MASTAAAEIATIVVVCQEAASSYARLRRLEGNVRHVETMGARPEARLVRPVGQICDAPSRVVVVVVGAEEDGVVPSARPVEVAHEKRESKVEAIVVGETIDVAADGQSDAQGRQKVPASVFNEEVRRLPRLVVPGPNVEEVGAVATITTTETTSVVQIGLGPEGPNEKGRGMAREVSSAMAVSPNAIGRRIEMLLAASGHEIGVAESATVRTTIVGLNGREAEDVEVATSRRQTDETVVEGLGRRKAPTTSKRTVGRPTCPKGQDDAVKGRTTTSFLCPSVPA